jgi:hypothetical protein
VRIAHLHCADCFKGDAEFARLAILGKRLRRPVHGAVCDCQDLRAAFALAEGWVLMQVEVDDKENIIPAASRVLKCLDLRGKVVNGDALLAQRSLSIRIAEAGGDYLWAVKDYLDWPHAARVFKLAQRFVRVADGKELC